MPGFFFRVTVNVENFLIIKEFRIYLKGFIQLHI